MPVNASFQKIAEAFHAHRRFLVLSHVRPDGDAIGCTLALALCLRELGKEVTVWNHDGMLEKLSFLPGSELLTPPPASSQPADFDVAIAVDTAVYDRLGADCLAAIGSARLWINIDHHVSNPGYGDLVYIDPTAPAAGQILYELIEAADLPCNAAIAENLFVAISTDTGSFQYANTTARTLEIAAKLVRHGIHIGDISEKLYQTYPRRRLELLRALLNATLFSFDDQVASFSLSLATAAAIGVTPEDNEGLIDHIRAVEGVKVAVFLEELGDGKIRISMRSKDPRFDVCKICARFGGGGHTLAAGARIAGTLEEAQAQILEAIGDTIAQPLG